MEKRSATAMIVVCLLLVLLSLVVVGCGGGATPEPTQAPTSPPESTAAPQEEEVQAAAAEHEETMGALTGDPVRGGLLYDMWWAVAAAEEADEHEHEGEGEHEHELAGPTTDHPLWSTQTTNTRSGEDTWRCKECHGWDYKGVDGAYGSGSHMTGFVGVIQMAGTDANEIVAALKGGTNPDHDFSTVMGDQGLTDLAVFISEALIDTDELVKRDKTSQGDAAKGQSLFEDVCAHCHGPGGNAINFGSLDDPEFLGHVAPDNPWEFIHKVRFGQPGWPMPSGISNDWTNEDVADVLAYAQGFATEPALSGGGKLYDMWWEVLGVDAPAEDQPLWATQTTNTQSGADTWRCKECHGWDYKGVDGAYGSGSHMTGFTGILSAASMSADELMAWLDGRTNTDHDFSQVMDEAALNALVTFIQQETTDIAAYVNNDKTVNGDPTHGRQLFDGTCAACHGVDGKNMNFGNEDEPEYVGTIAADNPWEFFHKASFGQPGVPMPAGRALGWTLEDVADLLSFAQTLPRE
jgi:mono/diheme cytochrome c family protein